MNISRRGLFALLAGAAAAPFLPADFRPLAPPIDGFTASAWIKKPGGSWEHITASAPSPTMAIQRMGHAAGLTPGQTYQVWGQHLSEDIRRAA